MRFAVIFKDNPDMGDKRQAHMAEHLAFLETHANQVLAAGPLLEKGAATGGLWLVEAPDAQAVRGLVESDPFWPTGLRKSVRILAWRQVFADGNRVT